jgi:hypothetical protein
LLYPRETASIYIPITYSFTESGYDTYVAAVSVRLCADPSTSVYLVAYSPTGTTGTNFITVSGYLV